MALLRVHAAAEDRTGSSGSSCGANVSTDTLYHYQCIQNLLVSNVRRCAVLTKTASHVFGGKTLRLQHLQWEDIPRPFDTFLHRWSYPADVHLFWLDICKERKEMMTMLQQQQDNDNHNDNDDNDNDNNDNDNDNDNNDNDHHDLSTGGRNKGKRKVDAAKSSSSSSSSRTGSSNDDNDSPSCAAGAAAAGGRMTTTMKNNETKKKRRRLFLDQLLYTKRDDGMSEQDFLRETYFMLRLNRTLPRYFVPGISRPRFAKILPDDSSKDCSSAAAVLQKELRDIFFTETGCLNAAVLPDVTRSEKHHYINFTNERSAGAADRRWQVPLKLHPRHDDKNDDTTAVRDHCHSRSGRNGNSKSKRSKKRQQQQQSDDDDDSDDNDDDIPTRRRFEDCMAQHNMFDPARERIHDLGLLLAGTEDQSLHHDCCRQWTCWLEEHEQEQEQEEDSSSSAAAAAPAATAAAAESKHHPTPAPAPAPAPVKGWEENRIAYNTAMAGPAAPCSMLIGMGNGPDIDPIRVGVQRDQIEPIVEWDDDSDNDKHKNSNQRNSSTPSRRRRRSRRCRVYRGRPFEEFTIVRQNEHLVVLDAGYGCVFTGDFPHAGVRNYSADTEQGRLIRSFAKKVDAILLQCKDEEEDDGDDDDEEDDYNGNHDSDNDKQRQQQQQKQKHKQKQRQKMIVERVLRMMCEFPNLNRICRLHCSTEPLQHDMNIPRNAVGYADCFKNRPDGSSKTWMAS